jgi:hypothetical protein
MSTFFNEKYFVCYILMKFVVRILREEEKNSAFEAKISNC